MLNKILLNIQLSSDKDKVGVLERYKRKESKERTIRGLGLFFVVIALVIQVIALTGPAKTSAAASYNDVLYGGVSSKQQIVNDCNDGYNGAVAIYAFYGVSCADIASASSTVVTLRSTDDGGKLYSVGHLPYNLPGETPVNVYGEVNGKFADWTMYWRLLHGWDTGAYSDYTALQV